MESDGSNSECVGNIGGESFSRCDGKNPGCFSLVRVKSQKQFLSIDHLSSIQVYSSKVPTWVTEFQDDKFGRTRALVYVYDV